MAMPAFALEDTPLAVIEAKEGVVRITSIDSRSGSAWTGSGFGIGIDGSVYIATNYHVVEGCDLFFVHYDTRKYVEASIVAQDKTRDICILKPDKAIPRLEILQLETEPFDSGGAVWALGFPAAADLFAQGDGRTYNNMEDFLSSVIADKSSMTITNGIISAFHDSILIGDGSRNVRVVQTTTAINGGNSGGPLLNRNGRVVGVNTMGITIADQMNGAVHVDELVSVLRNARIQFEGTPEEVLSSSLVSSAAESGGNGRLVGVLVFVGVVLLLGGVTVFLVVRHQRKNPVKGAIPLGQFDKSYRRIDDLTCCTMVIHFIDELLPLTDYDINPLLTPDNVVIGEDAIALRQEYTEKPDDFSIDIYPGYSAPENYQDQAGPAAAVYFLGAMMVTMITGKRPPEALGRKQQNSPVFLKPNSLQYVINRAMEPYEQNRLGDLFQLKDLLTQVYPNIQTEAGYY